MLSRLKIVMLTGLIIAASCALIGCSDDDSSPTKTPTTITSYDEVHAWDCATSVSCQDVFDIEFAAGATVDFSATETTGNSVLQIALYAPDKGLGDTNLFTENDLELRCGFVSGCSANTDGQTVTDFVIPAAGTYRLAVTRDWGDSCGGDGTYRLLIDADEDFSVPDQTVDDLASLATDWNCPAEDAMVHDETYAWSCATSVDCQDVFDIDFVAGTTVDISAIDVTGNSVLQLALYEPGMALGRTNLLTGDYAEYRCGFVSGCGNNTDGQTVTGLTLTRTGTYRLAITRDWGDSCGGVGTYHLIVEADEPMWVFDQTIDDDASAASSWTCP
ncbi:MAG: hypothetical protein GY838_03435 [bacterium]|nr:hypothetical protein [bacterium]